MEVASPPQFESDSGEQASINDDAESSQRWTTDFDDDSDTEEDDDRETCVKRRADSSGEVRVTPRHYRHRLPLRRRHTAGANGYRRNGGNENEDNEEEDDDEDTEQSDYNGYIDYSEDSDVEEDGEKRKPNGAAAGRRTLLRGGISASTTTAGVSNGGRGTTKKLAPQSDTETRNLLDDVGDFDDDCLDLEETFVAPPAEAPPTAGDSNSFDSTLFELSDEQYDYYVNCFMYLLATTQGHVQIDGALNGADVRIIDFFHKSRLDNGALSRVWTLADVNEDGFLNLAEFVVAMHVIVLNLRMDVPIPASLPPALRPPATPVRQLIRLADGNLASVPMPLAVRSAGGEDGSTTTTSAASSSNSHTSNFATAGVATCEPSQDGQLRHLSAVAGGTMSASLELGCGHTANDNYEIMVDSHINSNTQIVNNVYVDRYADFADAAAGCSSAGGVKQHSLSDDHLHLYAQQRDVGMTNFSDVPPVLVDSHPTALNALYTPLVLLGYPSSHRGPPPQPPPRDYAASSSNKGHARSASLDLKTFPSLSPSYAAKHVFAPKNSNENDDAVTHKSFPHLETLSEYLANPSSRQLSGFTYALREQFTQTDNFELTKVDALTSEYEDVFSTSDLYETLSTEARCDLLKRLNGELESERLKLAQIRLQLQLRIEEAESELRAHAAATAAPTKAAAAGNAKTASKSTAL